MTPEELEDLTTRWNNAALGALLKGAMAGVSGILLLACLKFLWRHLL